MTYRVTYPTLAELAAMTAQDIFDRAARHLLMQGVKSVDVDGENCYYRGPCGTACAVGALIPEDQYHPDMEEKIAAAAFDAGSGTLRDVLTPFLPVLSDLQIMHDRRDPETWPVHLERIAGRNGLRMVPLEGLAVIRMGHTA